MRSITSGTLSLNSLLFPPLISHNSPPHSSSVDFRPSHFYWCVLFAFLHKSSLRCPLYLLNLVHPLLLPTLSPTPKCSQCFSLKSFAFIFPISSQRTSKSFFHRPIIFPSHSFPPETLLAGYFFLSWCKGLRAICIDISVKHHKCNTRFRGWAAGFLSLTCREKMLLSLHWNLFNESRTEWQVR